MFSLGKEHCGIQEDAMTGADDVWVQNFNQLSSCHNNYAWNNDIGPPLKIPLLIFLGCVLTYCGNFKTGVLQMVVTFPFLSENALVKLLCFQLLWSKSWVGNFSHATTIICLVMLLAIDRYFLNLLPAICWSISFAQPIYGSYPEQLIKMLIICGSAAICFRYLLRDNKDDNSYQPSHGVIWYTTAVVFPEYQDYFKALFQCLPVIGSMISSVTIADCHNVQNSFAIAIKFSFLVSLFFSECVSLPELLFVLISILDHSNLFEELRFPLWLLSLFVIAVLIQPDLLHVWANVGSGNANYLFFVGFFSWAMLGLFIIESVSAVLRLESHHSKSNNPSTDASK